MSHTIVSNQRGGASKLLMYAIIVGVLGYGYYYFQSTPRYALIQFWKAVIFSDGPTAEKYLDVDSVAGSLPERFTRNQDREAVKKRIIYEIDSPHEKSMFASAKHWSVFLVPISVGNELATVEQDDGATIKLRKLNDRQWVITSIQVPEPKEPEK